MAHLVAHQWWGVAVGNDPAREPVLDEALSSWSSLIYYRNTYGEEKAKAVLEDQVKGVYFGGSAGNAKYDLSNELGRLNQDQQDLTAQLDAKASPTQLAAAAAALGMVPTNGTGWLRLSDGSVQGAPEPAGAGG